MSPSSKKNRVGLSLGGGAVRGLAHIGLLKLLDRYQLRPAHISGTSMGAIIGALYASGLSGDDIEARVREHIIEPGDKLKSIYQKRQNLIKWTKVFSYEKTNGGIVAADGLFTHLFDELVHAQFSKLNIPLTVCATDFHSGKEVVISEGAVLPAVRASMAVPGVFAPVNFNLQYDDDESHQLLVDGGLVNNLPSNHIQHCEFKIASDVMSLPEKQNPKTLDVVNGAINIMIINATKRSLIDAPVHLLHTVAMPDIEAFEFRKIDEVLNRGDKAAEVLIPRLETYLENIL